MKLVKILRLTMRKTRGGSNGEGKFNYSITKP